MIVTHNSHILETLLLEKRDIIINKKFVFLNICYLINIRYHYMFFLVTHFVL